MISGWDNLIDRCLLYADAPRQLIKNLLLEAEDELTREVDIMQQTIMSITPLTTYHSNDTHIRPNVLTLPSDYKKMIQVRYKGEVLP